MPHHCYCCVLLQGSVLNHVMLHQTVIGEEALLQLEKIGEVPDILVSHSNNNLGGVVVAAAGAPRPHGGGAPASGTGA